MTPEVQFAIAMAGKQDVWVNACGGTERPCIIKNRRILYCYNPALGQHAYFDLDQDLQLTTDEALGLLP